MKISLAWLSDMVNWTQKDALAIADRFTLGAAEVEEAEAQGALLEKCCVGRVTSVIKHPEADRLSVAEVETDDGIKKVVCGGTNVREGMFVAFAHIGATVKWHGGELMTLTPVKIRGVSSAGMICAAEELGLETLFKATPEDGERPIMDLGKLEGKSSKLQTGASLREALNLTDTILHINNTAITTRPDLFSHKGFAREAVALGMAKWKKTPTEKKPTFGKKSSFKVRAANASLVPRYAACVITVDPTKETPAHIRNRLQSVGIRSISLAVDITNFVMMELGMPLHAFDADTLTGKTLTFRTSVKGEKVTTLDGTERTLPDGVIVLEDDKGIFDLCGIMGDDRTAVTSRTTRIFVHAPVYDSIHIRRAMQSLSHRTDASTVYEKGVPPVMSLAGLRMALRLFKEHGDARIESPLIEWGKEPAAPAITLSAAHIKDVLGAQITDKDIIRILTDLECTVKTKTASLTITPPPHRRDLRGPHDIVEEVGRIYGYDRIDPVMPAALMRIPDGDTRVHDMRDALKECGYMEILPLSLVSPELLKKSHFSPGSALELQSPLSEETSVLHTSTVPSLLAHAQRNLLGSNGDLKTFHWSRVFEKGKKERTELSILLAAKHETDLLHDPFLQAKSDILRALSATGYDLTLEPLSAAPHYAHPGRCAALMLNGKTVGFVCELHPSIRDAFDLRGRAVIATVDLSQLLREKPTPRFAVPLSPFPSVTYDVTITRTHDQPIAPLLTRLRGGHPLLEDIRVHDLYGGKPLEQGSYNATLRCIYRSPERTLTEEEAKKAHEEVMKGMG